MSTLTQLTDSDELYVTGLNEAGEYVSLHKDTGRLLNSSDFFDKENFSNYFGDDFYHVKVEHDMAFFDEYNGQFVNGKREGDGKYMAMDISFSQDTLTYEGEFKNNLPHGEGKLTLQLGNSYLTEITGYFINGLPDSTKNALIKYNEYGSLPKKFKMSGLISYSASTISKILSLLDSNKPYNLINVYADYGFEVSGTRKLKTYEPLQTGVFDNRGQKVESSGGKRSKKRLNKRRHSHK
jgi:hypothetical protein